MTSSTVAYSYHTHATKYRNNLHPTQLHTTNSLALGLSLTLVKQQYNLVKDLHEIHVVIAVLLHPDQQGQLGGSSFTERQKERAILLKENLQDIGYGLQFCTSSNPPNS